MRKPRLPFTAVIAASAAACALATGASAQTSPAQSPSASGVQPSAGQVGAQSPADPSAPPPVNGPTNAPSTAPMSGGSMPSGSMTPGSMPSGSMPSGSMPSGSTSGGIMGQTGGTVGAQPPSGMTAPFTPITPAPGADIVAALQSSGQFTTLIKALAATNLTSVLRTKGPLTVFAPTDAAFAALPPGTLASLMQPAGLPRLQRILTYHVVAARLTSKEFLGHKPGKAPTAAQLPLTLDGETPPLKVDGVPVIQSDVHASNGTIFVIDKVLMPAG